MNPNRDQEQKLLNPLMRDAQWALGLMAMLASGAEMWLSVGHGARFFNLYALLGALVGPLVFAMFAPLPDSALSAESARQVTAGFAVWYGVHCLLALAQFVGAKVSPRERHDYDIGSTMWRPFGTPRRAGEELAVGVIAGLALYQIMPSWGAYVIASTLASVMCLRLVMYRDRRRIKRMRDSRREAEQLRWLYEQEYGDE